VNTTHAADSSAGVGAARPRGTATGNALAVAALGGIRDVPIAAGCARRLIGTLETGPFVRGGSGLDGPVLPTPASALDPRHAMT
jgi:purine nucleosidase